MIVKVQVSLFDSDDQRRVLIYDQKRKYESVFLLGELPQDVQRVLMNGLIAGKPKQYFQCSIRAGVLTLGDEVEGQTW